jgi:23S rRNA pseudouridine2605 synthase
VTTRLQKYLAEAGLGSRRSCEELIRAGRVTIDGETAVLGSSIDSGTQTVLLDGRPVTPEKSEYWLLNKPAGVLSAAVDARGRRTVVDCVPAQGRVFPVGRLDLESTGLLLLTNDGELTARLLHPRHSVEKEYVVTVRGVVGESALRRLRQGIDLEEGRTAPAGIEVVATERAGGGGWLTTLRVTLREGRKRQIRRMLDEVGHRVVALHRTRFAGLTDAGLAIGEARRLSEEEVRKLLERAVIR